MRRAAFGVLGGAMTAVLVWQAPVLAQPATVPGATFVGNEECIDCHEEEAEEFAHTDMGKILMDSPRNHLEELGCESCHGPGSAHAEDETEPGLIFNFGKKAKASVEEQNQACLQCHRKGSRAYWEGSLHESRGLACVNCHTVMEETSDQSQLAKADEKTPFFAKRAESEVCFQCHLQRRAQFMRSSHMPLREGKMDCADCHDPHGTATEAMLHEASVTENCQSCHAEKRGPFLWEHPPVREDCTNCHEAHGSIHPNLLKAKVPRLCQTCHIESRHPTDPQGPGSPFALNRGCTNCHSQIHGSNHPSGVRFMR